MVRSRYFLASIAIVASTACVQDPTVDDATTPNSGISQPRSDAGATISASDACSQLLAAEKAARTKLCTSGPATADPTCPGYLNIAGSLACGQYVKATVDACVAAMNAFAACSDFDEHPCVATVVRSSCGAVSPHDGGGTHPGPDASNGQPEASVPGADASMPDAAPSEAGSQPTDSGRD